ncbi:hypothetical protein O988_03101 [Pseudogymnoascus sp. VKM F-3808]|nr:hypothetical protein O988_03101 [Pseudogymnoascus sp. VKM F-3808]
MLPADLYSVILGILSCQVYSDCRAWDFIFEKMHYNAQPATNSDYSSSIPQIFRSKAVESRLLVIVSQGSEIFNSVTAPLCPSLMVVTEGSGQMGVAGESLNLEEGYVFFVGQGVPLEFSTAEGMSVYRAYAE